jgi:hypothetical protein
MEYNAVFDDVISPASVPAVPAVSAVSTVPAVSAVPAVSEHDDLYIANVVADFLHSVMPEGSDGGGWWETFMIVIKEHDYAGMFVCNMYHNNRHNYTPYTD